MDVQFGDIVSVKMYKDKEYVGNITYDKAKVPVIKKGSAMFFCLTPFGYFAEDEQLKSISIGKIPFILQQLTWAPGTARSILAYNRNVLVGNSRTKTVEFQPMDITTRDDQRAIIALLNGSFQVQQPRYGERYTMVINDLLASSTHYPFIALDTNLNTSKYMVEFVFEGSLEKSKNHPNSQAWMPFNLCQKCV